MRKTTTMLMAILMAMCCSSAMAAEPVAPANILDLTKSIICQEGKDKGKPWTDVMHDMNLVPTGLRGWMWAEANLTITRATRDARQILVTAVDSGSPADGKVNVGDVILGVNGKPFESDARRALAAAITAAETGAGAGKLGFPLGKRFDYFVYPHRDHGLSEGKGSIVHVRMLIARYLVEHLPPGPR